MKKIIITLVLLLESIGSFAQSPTLLGTHGSNDPQALYGLGAQIARYGFTDLKIKQGIINGSNQVLSRSITLDSLNIRQVLYLTWPDTSSVNEYERIPTGSDSIEVFQYLDTLINEIGPYIEYIQISQEPFGATSYDPNEPITNVLNWWKAVAQFIRNKQTLNPTDLGHIQLITGGITGVNGAINDPNAPIVALIDSVISFGETYCDAIDLHLHVVDVAMGESIINYIKTRTTHPLVCTEWSQSKAAGPLGNNWLNTVNSVSGFGNLTNKQIIDSAYVAPMDSSDWDMLIVTSPFTPNFISDFYAVMDSNCFKFSCFGGVFQFGSPAFDWDQLIASKTVAQYRHHNNPFYDDFKNLANTLSNGLFNTNCSTLGINDDNSDLKYNIYPNPFSDFTTIEFENKIGENYTLKLFNALGQNVQPITTITEEQIIIKRENLEAGIYFILLHSDSQKRISGKLIIK